jgi:hypothetical protein
MDGPVLAIYLSAIFVGGIVTGLAGFALGVVVSGVWLHILTPIQVAILIVGYGLISQGLGIWRLRHALNWRAVAPFVIGGLVGVPAGSALLGTIDPAYLRTGVGVLLLFYASWGLARPSFKPFEAPRPVELGIGVANGLLSGLTGLGGIVVTIWAQLRGVPKDRQRALFQPALFATLAFSLVSLSAAGAATLENAKLYALGLPLMLLGTWTGLRLYGRLDDAGFRRVVLVLLLVSGASLVIPMIA